MASDEKLWLFNGDADDLETLLESPDRWIKEHLTDCAGSRSGHYIVEFASQPPGDVQPLLFSGVCGTSVIVVTGNEVMVPMFAPLFTMTESTFWNDLDRTLLAEVESPEVEVFVLKEDRRIFVHFELGKNKKLHALLMGAVARDQEGFLEWIVGDRNPSVSRSMVSVASNGVQSKQDLKGLSFVPRGTFRGGYRQDIRMLYESLSGAGCVSPCFEVACNGVHGRILNVDEASGHMTCQLDMMFTKPYCRHPAGLNCPEPPPANP